MAKHIAGFWARLCGFFIGIIGATFDTTAATQTASCVSTEANRVTSCKDQGYSYMYDINGSDISDYTDAQLLAMPAIRSTHTDCSNSNETLFHTYNCDYQAYMCDFNSIYCTPMYCEDIAYDSDSKHYDCMMREEIEGSAGHMVSPYNGIYGYRGPSLIVGAAYRCGTNGTIEEIALCAENVTVLFGCASGIDMDGNLKTTPSTVTLNSDKKVVAPKNATMEKSNLGLYYLSGNTSLADAVNQSGLSCATCTPPANEKIASSQVNYEGGWPTVGATWDSTKCYYTASSPSSTNEDEFNDCTGTFYYPMATRGTSCICYYNKSNEQDRTYCS